MSRPLPDLTPQEQWLLAMCESEWPDSQGLIDRLAARLCAQPLAPARTAAQVTAMARAGLAGYATALREARDDFEHFGAFVDGLASALEPRYRPWLAQALTATQRRWLARRVRAHPAATQDSDPDPDGAPR